MSKMRNFVKLFMLLPFIVNSLQFEEDVSSSSLPNIWEDEVVTRMIQNVLFRDLVEDNMHKRSKKQHKREVTSTAFPIQTAKAQTTRKVSLTTQKTRRPTKVTQITGNKTKNRVTLTTSTKAPVKSTTNPIIANLSNTGLNNGFNASKIKVRRVSIKLSKQKNIHSTLLVFWSSKAFMHIICTLKFWTKQMQY